MCSIMIFFALQSSVPARPQFSGAGVVMVAENRGRVPLAYRSLAHMRQSGVTAPAELWVATSVADDVKV